MNLSQGQLDALFRAMGNRTRREILQVIRDSERPVGEIAEQLGVSQQVASRHLSVLQRAGLVTDRHKGTRRLFGQLREGLADVLEYLKAF